MSDNTYIFRLQKNDESHDLSNSLKHWGISAMYDEKQIRAIHSTNHKSLHQPTSIPSPFARIALVKTAFAEVAEYGDDSLYSYQKIVSDTLDVAELFFTFDKWKKKLEIVTWNLQKDLEDLRNVHSDIYKTYNTFLQNDAIYYNFDKMKCIYILKYKPTGEMIGATSPSTLFFSSGNEFKDIDIQLPNKHNVFDGVVPLHKRSWDFQKYLHIWLAVNNKKIEDRPKTSIFHEISKYLEVQKQLSKRIEDVSNLISNASAELNKSYKTFRAPEVEILGKPIHQSNNADNDEYLTVSDLLEDKIIQIPYEIRKESFFNGNIQDSCKDSFLLPIKEIFFKHYSIDDLKNFIKINQIGYSANVQLNINGRIYEKNYIGDDEIIKLNFDCAIFPNVKFENEDQAHYRFGLVYNFEYKNKLEAKYVKLNSSIDLNSTRVSSRNITHEKNFQLKNYSLEGSGFDYLEISYQGIKGIIIPTLTKYSGNDEFTFAIDFGTTNTHIEYKINNGREIKKFNISKGERDEKQVHWLHGKEDYLKNVFDEEYIPAYTDEEFKLPMRTALSYGEDTNWNDVYPFEKASLNELYEKRLDYPYNKTETNLKWSDDANYKKQVEVYIKSLMYLLRNKVVIGNGKLEKTKICWFYPVSMERQRYNNLVNVWNNSYNKYFGGKESNVISITESVAPFLYYIKDRNAKNVVTIDIGGGTTDIVISSTGNVDNISSFRFAANSIFGDGYSENNRIKNGIVRQFIHQIKKELQTKISPDSDLFDLFELMYQEKDSSDIASFLFSLKNNKKVKSAGKNLAENANLSKKLLDDDTQKITFIFFYTAIIYHLAKLLRAVNLNLPDKIVFSGNGSRVIQFFTTDNDLLTKYTKLVFEKVQKERYSPCNLEIIINNKDPKEATCKGGLFAEDPENYIDILKKKIVLHSDGTDTIINRAKENIDNSSNHNRYKSIDREYLKKTEEEVKKFIQFVFDILPFFDLEGYSINKKSIEIAKNVCLEKLHIHTETGWEMKKKEICEEDIIDETLFFYPLVGMLKELTDSICDRNLKIN